MNIKDALLNLAKNLEDDLAKWNERYTKEKADYKYFAPLDVCASYVREIRTIAGLTPDPILPQIIKPPAIKTALQEELKKIELFEDSFSPKMVYMVGGKCDGDMTQDPGIPVGAYTPIGNEVYQFQLDGKLYFSEEQTNRLKEKVK